MEKKIAYKVIRKHDRRSCFLLKEDGKYCLHYGKDAIIKATKGTLGVFCFSTKEHAQKFIERFCFLEESYIVIKIELLTKYSTPEVISSRISFDGLNDFYKLESYVKKPPNGTVCCQEVRVLE